MLNFLKAICLSITNKGPLGQKQPKEPKPKYRKPMPRVSEKRAAYKASPEGAAGRAHMGRVAQLPCLVCGACPYAPNITGKNTAPEHTITASAISTQNTVRQMNC
jgi:hypothetical protein